MIGGQRNPIITLDDGTELEITSLRKEEFKFGNTHCKDLPLHYV
jgi:hypothetical protein